jgi:hypothetical protein
MKISLSNNRSAGFSRIKVFACVLAVLVLGDVLFRSGSGLNSIIQLKEKVTTPVAAPKPTIPPLQYRVKEPELVPAVAVSAPKPLTPKSPVPPKKKAPRFGAGGDAGPLLSATSDKKDIRPVTFGEPRMTNPPPAKVPLPIALPN